VSLLTPPKRGFLDSPLGLKIKNAFPLISQEKGVF